MSLIYHEGYSGGLLSYPCTGTAPHQGVLRLLHLLLLVTLQCTYVLAMLSLDKGDKGPDSAVERRPTTWFVISSFRHIYGDQHIWLKIHVTKSDYFCLSQTCFSN
jgi:hypothetical protein